MCTNHGYRHYPKDVVTTAEAICCEDKELAGRLLDTAVHDGLAAFMNTYGDDCATERLGTIKRMMRRAWLSRRPKAIECAGEVVNRWQNEMLPDDLDKLPY